MRVHIARLGANPQLDAPAAAFERMAACDRIGVHELADLNHSDVILFPQCHMLPRDWRLNAIRNHPITKRHRDKVMVYDERDRPWCGFSGVYTSMPRQHFDDRYQRAWGYFPAPATESSRAPAPDLLYSFIGSPSHPCRNALFDLRDSNAVVERVTGFTFYDPESPDFERRRTHFQEVLQRSRFVLCPRGKGTSSIRLYETLAAGRVPVIISDSWVPPRGPDWDSFALRWPEASPEGLVEFLHEHHGAWDEMRMAAAAAHREFFAPEVWFHQVVELCAEIHSSKARCPRGGIRNGAFFASGAYVARWSASTQVRRTGKRLLRRLGLVR